MIDWLRLPFIVIRLVWTSVRFAYHQRQVQRRLQRIAERMEADGIRPRFGTLVRADGTEIPLVYHPDPDDPHSFIPKYADTEEEAQLSANDRLMADKLAPGQSIRLVVDHGCHPGLIGGEFVNDEND